MTATDVVEVRLLGFPLQLWRQSNEHHEELFRELSLLALRPPAHIGGYQLPQRLTTLIEDLTNRYSGIGSATDARRDDALAQGEDTVDLSYPVPAAVRSACIQLDEVLLEADEFCRQGRYLLTMPTPDEQVRFRRWYLTEFVAQIDGNPPTPFADYTG